MTVAQQRREEGNGQSWEHDCSFKCLRFLRDSVSCAKQLFLLILPPLSLPLFSFLLSTLFYIFLLLFFFILHNISTPCSLSIPFPSPSYFLLPLTGHQLSPGCYLYFLYHPMFTSPQSVNSLGKRLFYFAMQGIGPFCPFGMILIKRIHKTDS